MTKDNHISLQPHVVGVLPAAGLAARIAPLPFSKELYPIGFHLTDDGPRPKAVCCYLLESMRLAGITEAYVIVRNGKWDIPAYLGDGALLDMRLAYLLMGLPFGAPFTLDQAYPFVQDTLVALGFPDVVFRPTDAFVHLLAHQEATQADVVLGLFPTNTPWKSDMVDFDTYGRISRIEIKPSHTHLRYTWLLAVWKPTFTHFMHHYLANMQLEFAVEQQSLSARELFVGDILQAAILNGMSIDSVPFVDGSCYDIGTPESLLEAVRQGLV